MEYGNTDIAPFWAVGPSAKGSHLYWVRGRFGD